MITRLSIKNYAIIDNLEIEFNEGFSVFTGETGAGKSVLIGAIGLLLGEKCDSTVIRTGEEKAIIEGEFLIKNEAILQKIRDLSIDIDSSLIIRREISNQGRNRVFINGLLEPLNKLEEIGEWLLDIHGQHDHQLLLQQKVHLNILDNYGVLEGEIKNFAKNFFSLKEKIENLNFLLENQNRLEEERVFLELAFKEINEMKLEENEEEELTELLKRMENGEKISRNLREAKNILYDDERNVSGNILKTLNLISSVENFDNRYVELTQILEDALAKVDETSHLISDYLKELDFDENEMEKVIDRLENIKDLKRKYRKNSVEELISYAKECGEKLKFLENKEEDIDKLKKDIEELKKIVLEGATSLSKKRQNVGVELSKKIKEELKYLGMEKSEFIVDIKYVKDENSPISINGVPVKIDEKGIDRVEFLITTNPGEEPKPLRKIASGGEISRVMLALKAIFAKSDPVETMIFDEIDVGIGGVTANNVGLKMAEIAKIKQLFVITHLPQIASKAENHFYISKNVKDNKTFTTAKLLRKEERINEIARMLGGESEAAIKHAKEMLGL
ncbi:MAG: DNA repair protein RecN [Brevinematales bacterium]|nr:DNA repair protein RecN [Brevinematales bacterium]